MFEQAFNDGILAAYEKVGRCQHILRAERWQFGAGNGLCRADSVVSYDDSLDEHLKLKRIEPVVRRKPDASNILLDSRQAEAVRITVLAVGQRSSETGEPNGVSAAGSDAENPSSAPADEKGHMLLGRAWIAPLITKPVVGAGEGDRFAIKQLAQHDDRFFQPVDSNRSLVEADPRSLVLGLGMARPEPEFKTSVAEQVERCRLSGEKRRVVEVVVEHHDAQAEPTAHFGSRCQGHER